MSSGSSSAHVELPVTGMTCGSCAARVERRLNKVPGVTATVNYATERATVDYDPAWVDPEDLVAAVVDAGYGATLPSGRPDGDGATDDDELGALRRRLVASAVLSVPVVALAMVPALQFDGWAWAAGVLATPVVWWGGWGFHRAAWSNLRHRTATMDTLISLGSLSAWVWSVVALVFLGAGDPGYADAAQPGGAVRLGGPRRGVLRGGRRGRDVDLVGPLPGGRSETQGRRRPRSAAGLGRQGRRGARRQRRAADPDRGAAGRDAVRGAPGREGRHRRRRRCRPLGGGRLVVER